MLPSMSVASTFTAICINESYKAKAPSGGRGPPSEAATAALSPLQPSPLSQDEIYCFFYGLPSKPLLIARTGAPWKPIPTGNWRVPHKRELRPVGDHAIAAPGVWDNQVGPALLTVLDEEAVKWNTIDVHRIPYTDPDFAHEAPFPVVVCIGVAFGCLSGEDGARVAGRCQKVLDGFGLGDVEVAIKASERFRAAAPAFEEPVQRSPIHKSTVVNFRMPFTCCVGFPVSSAAHPGFEGTGGFFFTNGEDASKVFLLTARHVALETATREQNVVYDYESSTARPRRKNVTVFSDKGILEHMKSIRVELGCQARYAEISQRWFDEEQAENDKAEGQEEKADSALEMYRQQVEEAQANANKLDALYVDVAKKYLSDLGRTLGFLSYAPPISFSLGKHKYTEDVAIIEIDANKLDPRTFSPNVLDLGSEFKAGELTEMMCPRGWKAGDPVLFKWPTFGHLQLRDIVSDAELRDPDPQQRDYNGDRCIVVLKRGKTSGLTVGRLNNVPSYTRTYWEDGTSDVSMEWPIFSVRYGRGKPPMPFSEPGDSGSVVVDGKGRIAGIITGGAGFVHRELGDEEMPTAHVTYMMAAEFIRDQMHTRGIDMNVNFTLN